MANKFPRPDYLTNEEVDYELKIRGKEEETKDSLDAKQRLLRKLFFEDVREEKSYKSKTTIDLEFDYIMSKIEDISKILDGGYDDRCMARLKHYALRVERSMARDIGDEQLRVRLLGEIRKLWNKFASKQVSEDGQMNAEVENEEKRKQQQNEKSLELEIGAFGGEIPHGDQRKTSVSDKSTQQKQTMKEFKINRGAIPKLTDQESGKEDETEKLRKRVAELEEELLRVCKIFEENMERKQEDQQQHRMDPKGDLPGEERLAPKRIGFHEPTDTSRPSESQRHPRRAADPGQRSYKYDWYDEAESGYPDEDSWSDYSQFPSRFGNPQQVRHGEERRHQPIQRQRRNRSRDYEDRSTRRSPARLDNSRDRQERFSTPDRLYDRLARLDNFANRARNQISDNRNPIPDHRGDPFERLERFGNRNRQGPQAGRHQHRMAETDIINADRRMEKWHLTFNGDSRQRSLEDFLHKVRRLAIMDQISGDILLQRIHTILRGEAYDWYLCYADEFTCWADFERRIRYMYGNPNKDQGNRQKIYERKQLRNETFLTFKMEVERLNKLLSCPLDQDRLFEIVWDNMRPHYRSRLACRDVENLRVLEYYAYRIDANDPSLRQTREGPAKPGNVHNIEADDGSHDSTASYSDSEEVNAVGNKYGRDRKPRDDHRPGTSRTNIEEGNTRENNTPLCWN